MFPARAGNRLATLLGGVGFITYIASPERAVAVVVLFPIAVRTALTAVRTRARRIRLIVVRARLGIDFKVVAMGGVRTTVVPARAIAYVSDGDSVLGHGERAKGGKGVRFLVVRVRARDGLLQNRFARALVHDFDIDVRGVAVRRWGSVADFADGRADDELIAF